MLEWLPSALPITVGPYGFELVSLDAEGVRLKFFGLERWRGDVDRAPFVLECGFGFIADPRFDVAVRAWLTVVREVFAAADAWPRETELWLGPLDVCSGFEKVLKKKSAKDEAQLIAEWRALFSQFLPPSVELVEAAAELDALYAEDRTIARIASVSLHAVANADDKFVKLDRGCARLVIQLMVWDDGAIRDIKEQECVVIVGGVLTRDRVRAAFSAWGETLPRLFEKAKDQIETYMPHDLVADDLLELVKPQTTQDFIRVLEKRWKLEPAIDAAE